MTNFIEKLKQVAAGRTKGEWKWRHYSSDEFSVNQLDSDYNNAELKAGTKGVIESWDHEGYASGIHLRNRDAQFIALAANCFDELVHCVAMFEEYTEYRMPEGPDKVLSQNAITALRKKVEGE